MKFLHIFYLKKTANFWNFIDSPIKKLKNGDLCMKKKNSKSQYDFSKCSCQFDIVLVHGLTFNLFMTVIQSK